MNLSICLGFLPKSHIVESQTKSLHSSSPQENKGELPQSSPGQNEKESVLWHGCVWNTGLLTELNM